VRSCSAGSPVSFRGCSPASDLKSGEYVHLASPQGASGRHTKLCGQRMTVTHGFLVCLDDLLYRMLRRCCFAQGRLLGSHVSRERRPSNGWVCCRGILYTAWRRRQAGYAGIPQDAPIAKAFAVRFRSSPTHSLVASEARRLSEPPVFPSRAGGLVSAVDDYLKCARVLLHNGEADGIRLLSRKSVELMTQDDLTSVPFEQFFINDTFFSNAGFGFGLEVQSRRWLRRRISNGHLSSHRRLSRNRRRANGAAPVPHTATRTSSGLAQLAGDHVDSWTTLPSTTVSTDRIFLISTSGTEK
jgi:hypothetical protein